MGSHFFYCFKQVTSSEIENTFEIDYYNEELMNEVSDTVFAALTEPTTDSQFLTIRRFISPNKQVPQITITLIGNTSEEDQILFTNAEQGQTFSKYIFFNNISDHKFKKKMSRWLYSSKKSVFTLLKIIYHY